METLCRVGTTQISSGKFRCTTSNHIRSTLDHIEPSISTAIRAYSDSEFSNSKTLSLQQFFGMQNFESEQKISINIVSKRKWLISQMKTCFLAERRPDREFPGESLWRPCEKSSKIEMKYNLFKKVLDIVPESESLPPLKAQRLENNILTILS